MALSKHTVYDKLVTKVSGSDTKVSITSGGLVLKIRHDSAKEGLERKIKNVEKDTECQWAGQKDYLQRKPRTKLINKIIKTKIRNKLPVITGLATNVSFNTKLTKTEKKLPNIISLATQAALNTKVTAMKDKISDITSCIATPEFIRLTKARFDV